MHISSVSIGVAGTLGADTIARLAPIVEQHGFRSLWVNDTPTGDALAALAASAAVTSRLGLATGVLPVDRWDATGILARTAEMPSARLMIGIGSGGLRAGALAGVREVATGLGEADPDLTVLVGALGPKMRRLGVESADGVLLSWLTPEIATAQAADLHTVRDGAYVALYVRTALDDAAVPRLRRESQQYASYPNYAANFERLGMRVDDTVLVPANAAERLSEYVAGVDEVVLRAITPDDDVASYIRFIEDAAALLAH